MKNKLVDLQTHLFEMMERIMDDSLDGEKLKREVERSLVFNELAKTAVMNGALMQKCVDTLYGIPVSDDVPLIPKAKEETYLTDRKKRTLIAIPKTRDDGAAGYKKGRQQPI